MKAKFDAQHKANDMGRGLGLRAIQLDRSVFPTFGTERKAVAAALCTLAAKIYSGKVDVMRIGIEPVDDGGFYLHRLWLEFTPEERG